MLRRSLSVLILVLVLPASSPLSGARAPDGGGVPRSPGVRHDFERGDTGDESWRGVDADRDKLDAVTFVPGDYATLHEAIDGVLHRQRESAYGQPTVISLKAGSHLMPRRFRGAG
jgi:hypothetical protein